MTAKSGALKLLSYNIHKGLSPLGRKLSILSTKEMIRRVNPDIVMLQEVIGDHKHKRFHLTPNLTLGSNIQFEFLADEIWPYYAYGGNAHYNQGHHGNSILSKFPILSWTNLDISTNSKEQRGLLHATIEAPGSNQKIELLCTHLNLLEGSRHIQIDKIVNYIKEKIPPDRPLVFGGDFNDWKETISSKLNQICGMEESFLKLTGVHAKTFPSLLPLLKLDRIYYKNLEPIIVDSKIPFIKMNSDHLPLYSEFNFID